MAAALIEQHRAADAKRPEPVAPLVARRAEFVAFIRRRVQPSADAEDILHQCFVRIASRMEQLRDPGLVVPWFYRILRRALADHRAAAVREKWQLQTTEPTASELHERCACSLTLLATLPEPYAEVLRRVDVGEESLTEVAASLGTTVNNATVRLHRARSALRRRLRESCGTTSSKSCLDCRC